MSLSFERRGTGPSLLLLHGIGMSWRAWEPVLDTLAQERDVIAVDLPGFGASQPLERGRPPTVASLAQAVIETADALGIDSAHVAGNSLGGGLALKLARIGWARSATALSPIGFYNGPELAYLRATLILNGRLSRVLARHADAIAANRLARAVAFGQAVARPARLKPELAAAHLRALGGATALADTRAAAIGWRWPASPAPAVPVTVAWAQHDRLLLPSQARRAAAALPAARHLTLTGCGHVPMSDDPEQVSRVLLQGSEYWQ